MKFALDPSVLGRYVSQLRVKLETLGSHTRALMRYCNSLLLTYKEDILIRPLIQQILILGSVALRKQFISPELIANLEAEIQYYINNYNSHAFPAFSMHVNNLIYFSEEISNVQNAITVFFNKFNDPIKKNIAPADTKKNNFEAEFRLILKQFFSNNTQRLKTLSPQLYAAINDNLKVIKEETANSDNFMSALKTIYDAINLLSVNRNHFSILRKLVVYIKDIDSISNEIHILTEKIVIKEHEIRNNEKLINEFITKNTVLPEIPRTVRNTFSHIYEQLKFLYAGAKVGTICKANELPILLRFFSDLFMKLHAIPAIKADKAHVMQEKTYIIYRTIKDNQQSIIGYFGDYANDLQVTEVLSAIINDLEMLLTYFAKIIDSQNAENPESYSSSDTNETNSDNEVNGEDSFDECNEENPTMDVDTEVLVPPSNKFTPGL